MRKGFRILMILIGLVVLLRGAAELGLYHYGTVITAKIGYANRAFFSRSSRINYNAHYTFTLPDKSLCSGSGTVSSRSGREPSGLIKIVYLPVYPDFNSPYGSGQIFYAILWGAAGLFIIFYNINRFKKLLRMEKRAQLIFHSHGDEGSVSSPGIFRLAAIPIVIALAAGGYYLYNTYASEEGAWGPSVSENASMGNTPGNTANDGMYLLQNDKIFFVNWDNNHRLYSVNRDGSSLKPLTKEAVSNLNGNDGWIYYTDFNDGDKIYRIREDGSKRTKIYGWKSLYVNLAGDWLYLSNGNDHNKLYKVKTDGSKETRLNNDESTDVAFYEGWVYYNNKTDNSHLYRIRSDGAERTKLMPQKAENFIIDGGLIYFSNEKDGGKMYTVKTDGTELKLLSQEKAAGFNMDDSFIYYSSSDSKRGLYRMKKDGTSSEKLCDINPFLISLAGDNIYFIDFWSENKIYEIKKDGTGLRKLK